MIEVPGVLILFAIVAVPIGIISIIGNWTVAHLAVNILEEQIALCENCPTCNQRRTLARQAKHANP